MKKVSVVMPVHNTGALLNKSIGTLEKQSLKNFELICVDDASEDITTLQILDLYEHKFPFLKVLHLEKSLGAAEARNKGLDIATGEYVIFLDSDDEFDEFLLETMYNCVIQNDADICCCGYEEFYEDAQGRHSLGIHFPKESGEVTRTRFCLADLDETALTLWTSAPWKLFRRDFILENDIHFQTLLSSNDVYFSCMTAICARRICYTKCDRPLIFYRQNVKNQISANRDPGNLLKAVEWLTRDLEQRELYADNVDKVAYYLCEHAIYELGESRNEEECRSFYYDLRNFITECQGKMLRQNSKFLYFRDNLLKREYEDGWFRLMGDFRAQLEMERDAILDILKEYKKILLWGKGKRGEAFQDFCRINGVKLAGIVDRSNRDVGSITEYGFRIIDKKVALETVDLVMASNSEIYDLLQTEYSGIRCIDLSRYCPY